MTTFNTLYDLDGLDLAYQFCLPCFITSCDLEIDYKISGKHSYGSFYEEPEEPEIEYNKIVISLVRGIVYDSLGRSIDISFIPTKKQEDTILFILDDSCLGEQVWDNEICLQAEYGQAKAEWLYETKFDWRD